jgi:hypothetical protein
MADNRATVTNNNKLILFDQVEGICPKCLKSFVRQKKNKTVKDYEIAHIYPLNATSQEVAELSGEEKLSEDLNSLDNLIPLCPSCHTEYDNPKTRIEYRQMVELKKRIVKAQMQKCEWHDNPLTDEISKILYSLQENYTEDAPLDLSFDPKAIETKANETMHELTKRMIILYNSEFYATIRNRTKQMDSLNTGVSDIIATQVKLYYLQMRKITPIQQDIYEALVQWIKKKSGIASEDACRIVVAFYIQNCEVF